MVQNQRPHSRQKTLASGSASVHKGRQVNTGSRPVGAGGRGHAPGGRNLPPQNSARGSMQGGRPMMSGYPRGGGKKLSLKSLLLLAVVVIIIVFVLKNMGGGLLSGGVGDFISEGNNNFNTPLVQDNSNKEQPDYTVSPLARDKRVTPLGNGRDEVTIMVYMCGTDLESKHGMATSDLQEMLKAQLSDKVNLIIETGGCKGWKNNLISSSKNQIYKVENGGLRVLEDNIGSAAMTDPQNLSDFIKYCTKNYPADRNMLIFWDHGGGSLSGFGYDEKNPNASSMTLSKIDSALKNANCVFDCIGFDACLMATLETALVCNNYADYLIASEETEPGAGWHYTGWLSKLAANTSMPTVEIAQSIIDDFVAASCSASPSAKVTLSVMDLAELEGTVPEAFGSFAASTNHMLQSGDYQQVSNARAGVRQFAQSSKINQVDLVDLAQRIGSNDALALAQALDGCVKYNRSTISRCNGVSIYFPYESTSSVKNAVASYRDLGIDDEYSKCIQSFASLEYGGHIAGSASQTSSSSLGGSGSDLLGSLLSSYSGSGSSSPLGSLLGSFSGSGSSSSSAGLSIDPATIMSLMGAFSGRSMPADYDWVDTELIADQAQVIAENYLNPAHITASAKNGTQVLSLSEEEWALIQTVELNVFVNDGDGFIDLGLDNTFEWDDDNDLLLEYDGSWLTLNDQVCAYYLVSDTQLDDGSWLTVGRIPALLNGDFVNLQVVFDDENPEGVITGAYPLYDSDLIEVQAKGDIPVQPGDSIELLCDYYDLDGSYSASYTLGEEFTVPQSGLTLRNRNLEAQNVSVTYRLTDIYGNHYWTPSFN